MTQPRPWRRSFWLALTWAIVSLVVGGLLWRDPALVAGLAATTLVLAFVVIAFLEWAELERRRQESPPWRAAMARHAESMVFAFAAVLLVYLFVEVLHEHGIRRAVVGGAALGALLLVAFVVSRRRREAAGEFPQRQRDLESLP